VTVNAQFAALELSIDRDWLRPVVSFTYAREIGILPVGKPKGLIASSITQILLVEILASGIGKGYGSSA
jgi:hypothetical protein